MHGGPDQRISTRQILTHPCRLLSGEDLTGLGNSNDTILHGHNLSSALDKGEGVDQETVYWHRQENSERFEGREQSILTMSNITSASGEASVSSGDKGEGEGSTLFLQPKATTAIPSSNTGQQTLSVKRKRNLPGTPDPDAEVISLSPKTLLATNRFVCDICNKGFQRDQNLQLHRRGHNLPWKLKQRTSKEIKKRVYVCPETSCVHHDPSRALGDLTGIKKHFSRKHGEKKWKCEKCSKRYAVQSDWKAHYKTCGTREYRCDCGTLFSRRDSFITHRAFCDALAEESARVSDTANHSNILVAPKVGEPMIGALPPGTTSMWRFGGSSVDPLSFSSLNPGLPASSSGIRFGDNGLPLVQPRWEQYYPSGSGTPGSQSRLSLWLGTGPRPGAPGNDQLSVGPQQLQTGASASLNTLIADNDFFVQSPKSVQVGAAMMGLLTPSDYDGEKPLAGLNIPMGSFSEGNHYGRLFATGSQGQTGGISGVGMQGFADLGRTADWTDRSSSTGRLSFATSGSLGSSLACGNVTGADNLSSISSNQAHNHTAQMSATALLQKATQMGAKASNTSLLRGFGMAGSDSSSANMESAWQASRTDHGRRMPSTVSSVVQSHAFMESPSDLPSAFHGLGSSLSSAHVDSTAKSVDNTSLYELMNTLSTNGLFGRMPNLPPTLGPYGDSGILQFSENEPGNNQISSRGRVRQVPQHSSHGGAQNPLMGTTLLSGLRSLPKGDDGLSDRLTRDFLGVGGESGMVGATGGGGRTVSQRNISSTTSLGTGMERNNTGENLGSLGVSRQSSGKSWDD